MKHSNIILFLSVISSFYSCEILDGDAASDDAISDSGDDPFIGTWEGWIDVFDRQSTYNIYSDGTILQVAEPAPAINNLSRGCVPSNDAGLTQISFLRGEWRNLSDKIGNRDQTLEITLIDICGEDGTTNYISVGARELTNVNEVKFNKDFTEWYPLSIEGETINGERMVWRKIEFKPD